MTFQASDLKSNYFFDFSDNKLHTIKLLYINHTSIKEYCLRFFPRYNKYWNLLRFTLSHLLAFLEFNPSAFFYKSIT